MSAIKPCNIHKNRNQDVISIETARVHLTPKPGIDGSDYINATWIAGFHRNREFIITQHPMENTIMEFWQMMWDYNAQTVVMLTECNEVSDTRFSIQEKWFGIVYEMCIYSQEYPEFWPTEGKDLESETFRVRSCGIKETASGMILREVAVRSLQDDYELSAKIVQGPRSQPGFWPHNTNPRPFVTLIHDLHRDYQNGPIVVMDRYGGVEAAIFVLLTTLNKQLDFEKTADIYMFAKLLYMKRPGVFRSKVRFIEFVFRRRISSSRSYIIFTGGLRVAVPMSGDHVVVERSRRTRSIFDGKWSRVDDNRSDRRADFIDATHAGGLFPETDDDQGIRYRGGELHVRLFDSNSGGSHDGAVQ